MNILNKYIPVVMFHSLKSNRDDKFYLSWDTERFVSLTKKLLKNGFTFVTVEQIVNSEIKNIKENKYICFTFDDGYYDNFTELFPIIKELNVPVTIFLSTDFIHKNKTKYIDSKKIRHYLNEKQIMEMSESQLVDFQAHSKTHTWYPTSGVVKSVLPKEKIFENPWIYWNKYPKEKGSVDLDRIVSEVDDSFVLYENDRALSCLRYLPVVDEFNAKNVNSGDVIEGRYESEQERIERYEEELISSKLYLESLLNKQICFLCWPGGQMNETSYEVFKKAGYSACSMPSNTIKVNNALRIFDDNQNVIIRTSPINKIKGREIDIDYMVERWSLYTKTGTKKTIRSKLITIKYYLKALVDRKSGEK